MTPPASDKARRTTTRCCKNFACLGEGGQPRCRVEDCVNGRVHFLECLNEADCPYHHSFGKAQVCTCPVRKELFNRHRI